MSPGGLRSHWLSRAVLRQFTGVPVTSPRRSPVQLGSFRSKTPPTNVVRLMRWVRFGAAPDTSCWSAWDTRSWPLASFSPLTVWQRAHWLTNTDSPVSVDPAGAGAAGSFWLVTHFWKSGGERATTRMRMLAWERPQNSVHWPRYSPGSSASIHRGCTRPGTASRLPLRRGIQNEWITSREVMASFTLTPVGMTISSAVTIGPFGPAWPGYWNSHHHCWPITVTSRVFVGSLARSNTVLIVGTATTARMTAGMIVHVTSSLGAPWIWRGTSSWSGRWRNLTIT